MTSFYFLFLFFVVTNLFPYISWKIFKREGLQNSFTGFGMHFPSLMYNETTHLLYYHYCFFCMPGCRGEIKESKGLKSLRSPAAGDITTNSGSVVGHSNGKAFWDTRVWLISLRRMEPDYNCLQGKQRPWTMFFVLQQSLWNMPPPNICCKDHIAFLSITFLFHSWNFSNKSSCLQFHCYHELPVSSSLIFSNESILWSVWT